MNRREFLKSTAVLTSGIGARSSVTAAPRLPSLVGYATIAWPRERFEDGLSTISKLGFGGVQLLGWVKDDYSGPQLSILKKTLSALKLKPVALSCWGVRLAPEGSPDDEDLLRSYAVLFQRLGGLYLQVTDGGRPDREYSAEMVRSLGQRMNELGKIAQDHGLVLGYHPHFNSLGETREGLGRVLEATDPRYVKLIADVGHLKLGGADPVEVLGTYGERLIFLHLKDVRKDVEEFIGKDREAIRKMKYHFCEVGEGIVDFPGIVRALVDVRFKGWVIVELDGNEPPPGGPEESAQKNLQAVRRLGFHV